MKFIVNLSTNKLMSVYKSNRTVDSRKNCYSVFIDNINEEDLIKNVKKGFWSHLKDEDGNLLWQDVNTLKPLMGYTISNKEAEVNIFNNLDFWTLKEVLELKYRSKLSQTEYSHVFYDEFIDEVERDVDKQLHVGKKVCYGTGNLYFDLDVDIDTALLTFEFNGEKPTVFLKAKKKKKYLEIQAEKGQLTSFAVYFNSSIDEEKECIGKGILKK